MSDRKKYQLEFTFKCSVSALYSRISTPSGLSEWFADDVNIKDNIFTFIWEGQGEDAELISKKDKKHIRLHWLEHDDDSYFEFKIEKDELTGDLALIITDFAEDSEKEDAIGLWNSQIDDFKRALGL